MMKVRLLHASPLELADLAISKCWDKESRDVGHMVERMERVGNKFKHASTLEHINYTFDIDGISRACLQELARHRHQSLSLSVKSTRYTLKELKEVEGDFTINVEDRNYASNIYYNYCISVNDDVDYYNAIGLNELRAVLQRGMSNDKAKYMIPEAYKTSLVSTMNMRALQNFLSLRTDKSALWEIRELSYNMYDVLPDAHKFMLKDFVKEYND